MISLTAQMRKMENLVGINARKNIDHLLTTQKENPDPFVPPTLPSATIYGKHNHHYLRCHCTHRMAQLQPSFSNTFPKGD
jgi:hypothetical protein